MSKQLDELNREWKWYDYVYSWYLRIIDVLGDLRRSFFSVKKLRQGGYLFKFWLRYYPFDSGYGLDLLLWDLKNLLQNYENTDIYVGQDDDQANLEKLIHHLEIFINEDYGDVSEIGINEHNKRYDENKTELLRYFGMIDKFWI